MHESTVVPCAAHSPSNLTPATGADSQADATSGMTKGVHEQATHRNHWKGKKSSFGSG